MPDRVECFLDVEKGWNCKTSLGQFILDGTDDSDQYGHKCCTQDRSPLGKQEEQVECLMGMYSNDQNAATRGESVTKCLKKDWWREAKDAVMYSIWARGCIPAFL